MHHSYTKVNVLITVHSQEKVTRSFTLESTVNAVRKSNSSNAMSQVKVLDG